MLVFIDVGAFHGERTLEALGLGVFDSVYAFEPSPSAFEILEENLDIPDFGKTAVTLVQEGLWDRKGKFILHYEGTSSASIFPEKMTGEEDNKKDLSTVEGYQRTAMCSCQDILSFLESFSREDRFIIKLNCEGAECDILNRITTSKKIMNQILGIGIDFDVVKVPSQISKLPSTLARLIHYRIPFVEMANLKTKNRVKTLVELFVGDYK